MKVVNYTEFKKHLAEYLDNVINNAETIIVARGKGKSVGVMSFDEYNAFKQNMYLASTKANRGRLDDAMAEMDKGKFEQHTLIE